MLGILPDRSFGHLPVRAHQASAQSRISWIVNWGTSRSSNRFWCSASNRFKVVRVRHPRIRSVGQLPQQARSRRALRMAPEAFDGQSAVHRAKRDCPLQDLGGIEIGRGPVDRIFLEDRRNHENHSVGSTPCSFRHAEIATFAACFVVEGLVVLAVFTDVALPCVHVPACQSVTQPRRLKRAGCGPCKFSLNAWRNLGGGRLSGLLTRGILVENTGQGDAVRQSSETATERRIHPASVSPGASGIEPESGDGHLPWGRRGRHRPKPGSTVRKVIERLCVFRRPFAVGGAGRAKCRRAGRECLFERGRDGTPGLARSLGQWPGHGYWPLRRRAHDDCPPSAGSEQPKVPEGPFDFGRCPVRREAARLTTHRSVPAPHKGRN